MNETTNITDTELEADLNNRCPDLTSTQHVVVANVSFYVEGITLPILAFFGISINVISAHILTKKDMKNR